MSLPTTLESIAGWVCAIASIAWAITMTVELIRLGTYAKHIGELAYDLSDQLAVAEAKLKKLTETPTPLATLVQPVVHRAITSLPPPRVAGPSSGRHAKIE